ncbi:hypothetical protein ACA910_005338 [Epithemia clementina (nom. ined.)]
MSWFGGGSKKDDDSGGGEKSFVGESSSSFGGGDFDGNSLGGGNSAGMHEFQQASIALQQQLLVQTVITDLADRAFVKCVTSTKDSKLSAKEASCIQACTNKWLDTNEFLARRLNKKGEQMMQQQQGGYS